MLQNVKIILLCLLLVHLPAFAVDNEPSDASIKELFMVTQKKQAREARLVRLASLMKSTLRHSFNNKAFTPEQQKVMDDMEAKAIVLFEREVSWESIEPNLIEVYKKTYTQQEINGMLAFYKSPAGQAVIAKQDLVSQNSMQIVQSRMLALQPKLEQLQQETMERLKAVQPLNNTQ